MTYYLYKAKMRVKYDMIYTRYMKIIKLISCLKSNHNT